MSNNPSSTTTPVACRLPNPVYAALAALAEERGIKPGAVAAALISEGIAQQQRQSEEAKGPKKGRKAAVTAGEGAKAEAKGPKKGRKAAVAATEPAQTFDLVLFAAQVLEAGKRSETGKFDEDRIFINHVWRQYEQDAEPENMDLRTFKQRLAEANNQRYLSLVCADMAPMLDQKDVKESETRWLSATFHLLCL